MIIFIMKKNILVITSSANVIWCIGCKNWWKMIAIDLEFFIDLTNDFIIFCYALFSAMVFAKYRTICFISFLE